MTMKLLLVFSMLAVGACDKTQFGQFSVYRFLPQNKEQLDLLKTFLNKNGDRLWANNRSPFKNGNTTCFGVDLNRNFGLKWTGNNSTENSCNDDFSGPAPFSEVETKNLSEFFKNLVKVTNKDVYLTVHSYNQHILYLWASSPDRAPLAKTLMKLLIALILVAAAAVGEKARFDNYRVHRVIPKDLIQVEALRSLELSNEYNFWTEARNVEAPVDIMVPPHKRDEFQDFVREQGLKQEIKIENVQSLIDDEESVLRSRTRAMEWSNYHTLDEIYKWLDELAAKYPKIVKVVVGGKTYEGRQIKGIEINFGKNLTGIFIESGIHAREWIAPAGSTWVINEILKGSADPVFQRFNYLYFPVYNPDGYVYAWTTNRMWRKTRTPYKSQTRTCYGADPNRNWDCHWNEVGASKDPCSETYAGPKVFSEVETKTMSEYLNKVSKARKQDIFLSYHSYGQMILYPWGWTTTPSKNDKIFSQIGNAAAKELASVHGTKFKVGSIAKAIYPTSGTSLEWYYQSFNGTVEFVYEMRDTGNYGFVLPPKFILPCAQEHLASLKRILLDYEALKK